MRIDELLISRGLAGGQEGAKALLLTGNVLVGDTVISRMDFEVKDPKTLRLRIKDKPYVSRAGVKLNGALQDLRWHRRLKNCRVLDVGSSTGGFTDCCLRLGASEVWCVDVGTNQLDWSLRKNPKVRFLRRQILEAFLLLPSYILTMS